MKTHIDYPVTVTLTFNDENEKKRVFHCDEAAFLDPLGEWFGIIVDDNPVFSIPRSEVKYVETVYNGKKESSKEENYTH